MESEKDCLEKLKYSCEMLRLASKKAEEICDVNLDKPGYISQLNAGYNSYKIGNKYETFKEMEIAIYYYILMNEYKEKLINNYRYDMLNLLGAIGHIISGDLQGYKEYGNYKLLGEASWEREIER
jgi:hypothetical protein